MRPDYVESLEGPFGNPYEAMRAQRTRETFEMICPRASRLATRTEQDDAFRSFIQEGRWSTRFFRDAALELAEFVRARAKREVQDLIDLEMMVWRAGYSEAAPEETLPPSAFAWDCVLVRNPTLRTLVTEHAVYEHLDPGISPRLEKSFICAHRRRDHSVITRWMGELEYGFLIAHDRKTVALENLRAIVSAIAPEQREATLRRLTDFTVQLVESEALLITRSCALAE